LGERPLSQALTETEAPAIAAAGDDRPRLAASRHPGLQRQFGPPLGEDNGAALGVEDADGIPEDRLKQVLLALQVAQMVAGTYQGQQLLASPGAAVAVKGQVLQGLVEGGTGHRLDREVLFAAEGAVAPLGVWNLELVVGRRAVDQCLDYDRNLAELQ